MTRKSMTVRFHEEWMVALKAIANDRNRTISDLVRLAVEREYNLPDERDIHNQSARSPKVVAPGPCDDHQLDDFGECGSCHVMTERCVACSLCESCADPSVTS